MGNKYSEQWANTKSVFAFGGKRKNRNLWNVKASYWEDAAVCVRLVSLLWTCWIARTGRGFKHWRRTWGYTCRPSDLGQGTSWDTTKHWFLTDISMLTHKLFISTRVYILKKSYPLYTVVCLIKARTMEAEKQPLLDNGPYTRNRGTRDVRCDVT
jgi:hypothetical protein